MQNATPPQTPSAINITILGLPSAGKTVFIAALFKTMSEAGKSPRLLVNSSATENYCASLWDEMEAGKWPASTASGMLQQLRWTWVDTDNQRHDMRLLDCAGQDVRIVFHAEVELDEMEAQAASTGAGGVSLKGKSGGSGELSPAQLMLADAINQSDIVVLLFSLQRSIDLHGVPGTNVERRHLDFVPSVAIRKLAAGGTKAMLLVTQKDRFEDLLQAEFNNDIFGALKKYTPRLHEALEETNAGVGLVSAVETERRVMENGLTALMPKVLCKPGDMASFMSWMERRIHEVKEEKAKARAAQEADAERMMLERAVAQKKAEAKRRVAERRRNQKKIAAGIVALLLASGATVAVYVDQRATEETRQKAIREQVEMVTHAATHAVGAKEEALRAKEDAEKAEAEAKDAQKEAREANLAAVISEATAARHAKEAEAAARAALEVMSKTIAEIEILREYANRLDIEASLAEAKAEATQAEFEKEAKILKRMDPDYWGDDKIVAGILARVAQKNKVDKLEEDAKTAKNKAAEARNKAKNEWENIAEKDDALHRTTADGVNYQAEIAGRAATAAKKEAGNAANAAETARKAANKAINAAETAKEEANKMENAIEITESEADRAQNAMVIAKNLAIKVWDKKTANSNVKKAEAAQTEVTNAKEKIAKSEGAAKSCVQNANDAATVAKKEADDAERMAKTANYYAEKAEISAGIVRTEAEKAKKTAAAETARNAVKALEERATQ